MSTDTHTLWHRGGNRWFVIRNTELLTIRSADDLDAICHGPFPSLEQAAAAAKEDTLQ